MSLSRKAVPFLGLATLAALGLSAARPAAAQVTVLTGGDPGEGFSPRTNIDAAVAYNYDMGTLQNVTFNTNIGDFIFTGGPSAAGPNAGGPGSYFTVTTTNDQTLDGVLSHEAYNSYNPLTVYLQNLTPNTFYQVDSLLSTSGYAGRTEDVSTFAGGVTFNDTVNLAQGNGGSFVVSRYLKSDAKGNIGITYSARSDASEFNGIVVSDGAPLNATPEPSQTAAIGLGILGLAGLALKARRRTAI